MKFLSFLHRWSGGFIGLLLAILGLSGSILLWESQWVSVPGAHDPAIERIEAIGAIARARSGRGRDPNHLRRS